MNKEIPIFFTIDDTYAPFVTVAIKSIIENASKEYNYRIVILYQDLTIENMNRISKISNEKFKIDFIYMKDEFKLITNRIENCYVRLDYFTLTIFFRLLIPDMFPEYDKGIYIDSDVVVPGDISELYNTELGNNLLGVCNDISILNIKTFTDYVENAVGVSKYKYFNSGVLLMNLKELRDRGFSNKFFELLDKYHFDCVAPDQDYLNAICKDRVVYLDEAWDAMPAEGRELIKNPKIIHYNLNDKPWQYDNIQYEEYFWKYAKMTDLYDEIVKFKNNYSDEKKKADSEGLNLLLKKAIEIPNSKITFKKISEMGEKISI